MGNKNRFRWTGGRGGWEQEGLTGERGNEWNWGHFRDDMETYCNGNSMESMRAMLAIKFLVMEDTESELAIFYNQARPQVEGLGH